MARLLPVLLVWVHAGIWSPPSAPTRPAASVTFSTRARSGNLAARAAFRAACQPRDDTPQNPVLQAHYAPPRPRMHIYSLTPSQAVIKWGIHVPVPACCGPIPTPSPPCPAAGPCRQVPARCGLLAPCAAPSLRVSSHRQCPTERASDGSLIHCRPPSTGKRARVVRPRLYNYALAPAVLESGAAPACATRGGCMTRKVRLMRAVATRSRLGSAWYQCSLVGGSMARRLPWPRRSFTSASRACSPLPRLASAWRKTKSRSAPNETLAMGAPSSRSASLSRWNWATPRA